MRHKRIIIFTILISIFLFHLLDNTSLTFAQTATPTPTDTPTASMTPTPGVNTSQVAQDLQNKINDLQNKINDLHGQETTLSSQISVMDSQQKLTEYKIQQTKQDILSVEEDIDTTSKKVTNLENSLSNLTHVLMSRIVANYVAGNQNGLQELLSSSSSNDLLTKLSYLKLVQNHDQHLLVDTMQAKSDYANQKQIFQDKKNKIVALEANLEAYTNQLQQEKSAKQDLLTETQGSEANYQTQLAQYKAQLSSLSNFATSRAGSGGSIISHQDLSDSWGKYYNQRDANWGNNMIGLSSEQIWQVGCLMTSYAMVSSHFGANMTPSDVAANSDNFSIGTAYFKLPGPSANGHSAEYVSNPSISSLKNLVSNGTPVIAGLSANGGPYPTHYSDHWVVLRSVNSDGSFNINDPWEAGGMNVNINDHYSGWTIIEARIYH